MIAVGAGDAVEKQASARTLELMRADPDANHSL